jgi:radical SAM protein with 4Fe4S-binding SPASM domain
MKVLKYISFLKLINITKVYLGYILSISFKKVFVFGYPYSLTTEPTNLCNLNCLECPTGNKTSKVEKGKMTFENYVKIIDQVKKYIVYQMLYFQGEPFLNPDLFKMIKYSDDNRIYTSLSTNGHFLSEQNCEAIIKSGLKKIIISLDGLTQESYEKYRVSGDLKKVQNGIQNLVKTKQKNSVDYPMIIIQFLVFKHNENEIEQLKSYCKGLKIDKLELKSAQITSKDNFDLIPKNNKYSRYKFEARKTLIKSSLKNRCYRIWSTILFTWNGTLLPCCFDKKNQHEIGNLIDNNAFKIWNSDVYNKFRKNILKNRKQHLMCCNCTEGLKK